MPRGLATPSVIVNNVPVDIKPNSIKYKDGFGEYKQRIASGGGGRTSTVFTKDVETAKGYIAFMLYTTKDNAELIRSWKANEDANVVQLVDGTFNRTLEEATIVNEYEVNIGVDGEVELTFEGQPLS